MACTLIISIESSDQVIFNQNVHNYVESNRKKMENWQWYITIEGE